MAPTSGKREVVPVHIVPVRIVPVRVVPVPASPVGQCLLDGGEPA